MRSLEEERMREGDRKRMGPADSNRDAENGRRARVTLSLFGVVMLVVGLLVVFGGLGAGDRGGDGDDAATVAESNETETERNATEDTEEPRVNETETTKAEMEANKSTEEMNETGVNETEGTEKSEVNGTRNTTGSDIGVIEPESGSEQRIQNRLESLNPARNSSIHV